jgi:hypothetical protein
VRDGRRGFQAFFDELEYRMPVLIYDFYPCPLAHLWKVNPPEKEPNDEMKNSIPDVLVPDRFDSLRVSLRAV